MPAPMAPPLPAAQPKKVKLNSSGRRRIQQEKVNAAKQSSTRPSPSLASQAAPPSSPISPAGVHSQLAAVESPGGATPTAAAGPAAAADPADAAGPAAQPGQQSRSQRRAQQRKTKGLLEKAADAAAADLATASAPTATPGGSQSQATQAPQAAPKAVQTSNVQAAAPAQLVAVLPTKTRVPILMPQADGTTATAVATAANTVHTGASAWLETAVCVVECTFPAAVCRVLELL